MGEIRCWAGSEERRNKKVFHCRKLVKRMTGSMKKVKCQAQQPAIRRNVENMNRGVGE